MKLSPPSQVLLRNVDELAGERMLVIDSPGGEIGPLLSEHHPEARITLVQTQYSDYLRAKQRIGGEENGPLHLRFCAWYASPPRCHDVAIVYLPKSKAMLDLTLDMVAGVLAPSGAVGPGAPGPARVLLVGPVRGGIKSGRPALERRFGTTAKLDGARRCALYSATVTGPSDRESQLNDWGAERTFQIAGRPLKVFSYPGVFSHGRLDDGTRMLLETLDPTGWKTVPTHDGGVLDFGCGCGVIGAWIHACRPEARIEMVDSSALALEAARKTAALNGMPHDCVYPSNVLSDVGGRYGLIISNPPFHAGFKTDYAVVQQFLRDAADRLVDGGALRLVANRFHKYKPLIQNYVGPCRTVAEDARYRVYEAVMERST